MRHALKIDEASLGPDHPTVARRLNNLATLLQDMNRLAEAEPLTRRALKIDEASFGPSHPDVARDLNNLATLLEDQGHWSAAVTLRVLAKPIMIGAHGASELERGGLGKAVLAQNTGDFRAYARALYRADASDAANRADGFELAQWALQNSAADALSSMAARFAKGGREACQARARAAGFARRPRGRLSQPRCGGRQGRRQGCRSRARSHRGDRGEAR